MALQPDLARKKLAIVKRVKHGGVYFTGSQAGTAIRYGLLDHAVRAHAGELIASALWRLSPTIERVGCETISPDAKLGSCGALIVGIVGSLKLMLLPPMTGTPVGNINVKQIQFANNRVDTLNYAIRKGNHDVDVRSVPN